MATNQIKERVRQLWQNPQVGLTGVHRFQQKLSSEGIDLSKEEISSILNVEPSHHLFSHNTRAKKWNTIVETGVGHGVQMDLMDMSKVATRNKNFHWILCIVDVYSRFAWAFPVKRKTQQEIYTCLKQWLESLKVPPKRMTSDAGTEFTSKKIVDLLRSYKIRQYVNQAGDKTTTGIVERFNRTLRDLLGRNFARLGKLHWVEDLSNLVKNYNQSVHSTLGVTPEKVWTHELQPKPRKVSREDFPFKEGDHVRVMLPRGIFDKKAGSQKWSTVIYTVSRREGFKYLIKNSRGDELKTKYRPTYLRAVTKEEVANHEATLNLTKSKPIPHQLRQLRSKQRSLAVLRKHGVRAADLKISKMRPSTVKQRLRARKR